MKNKSYRSRALALILALLLMATSMPLDVLAEDVSSDDVGTEEIILDESTSDSEDGQNVSDETEIEEVDDSSNSTENSSGSENGQVNSSAKTYSRKTLRNAPAADYTWEVKASEITKRAVYNTLSNEFGTFSYYRFRLNTASEDSWTEANTTWKYDSYSHVSLSTGTYIVQTGTRKNILSPIAWSDAGTIDIKIYNEVTFNVQGSDQGGVQIAGADVVNPVKVYDTAPSVSFSVKQVDGYEISVAVGENLLVADESGIYTLSDVTSDKTVNVTYDKIERCIVKAVENDNASILINAKEADSVNGVKVPNNEYFTIEVQPDSGYAVTDVTVTESEGEVEPSSELSFKDTIASLKIMAGENKEYTVKAELVKVNIALKEGAYEVGYLDGLSPETLRQRIFDTVVDTGNSIPSGLTVSDVTVQYLASKLWNEWTTVGETPTTLGSHKFGARGEGSTETVRFVYGGNDQYPSVTSESVEVTLVDLRKETILTLNEGVEVEYNADSDVIDAYLRKTLIQSLTDEEGNPVEYSSEEDIEFEYTNAAGEQSITVTYKGNEDYKGTEATGTITITKAKVKVHVPSQSVIYGEDYTINVTTDPAGVDTIKVIAGVDGEAAGFVSIYLTDSIREKLDVNIPIIGNPYDMLVKATENGVSPAEFADVLNKIIELTKDIPGIDLEAYQQILDIIAQLPTDNTKIYLEKQPTKAGIYMVGAITANSNYETAVGVGYLTIAPKVQDVKLVFNQEFDNKLNTLPFDQMNTFVFGGHLEGIEESTGIRTFYAGTSFDGKFHTNTSPILEPGIYSETVYVLGGNYFAKPITRIYTIQRQKVEIRFEPSAELETTYDGKPHGLTAGVYAGDERIADAAITYIGTDEGSDYNSKEAPVDVGSYKAVASYCGDAIHQPAKNNKATVLINPCQIVVGAAEVEKDYDGKPADSSYILYDKDGNVIEKASEDLVLKLKVVTTAEDGTVTEGFPTNAGIYSVEYAFDEENQNPNYAVTFASFSVIINKKDVTVIPVEGQSKVEYEDDPETYEYTVEGVVEGESVDVTVSRAAGEEIGQYGYVLTVNPDHAANSNYNFILDEDAYFEIVDFIPAIIKGQNGIWIQNSGKGLSFTSNAKFADFLSVSVDGQIIDVNNYTAEDGTTIITLKPEYLATLLVGKHTLSVNSRTGSAVTEFTILAAADQTNTDTSNTDTSNTDTLKNKSIKTGDANNLILWIALLASSGVCVAGISGKRKKNR